MCVEHVTQPIFPSCVQLSACYLPSVCPARPCRYCTSGDSGDCLL